jgi:hypothetical protein
MPNKILHTCYMASPRNRRRRDCPKLPAGSQPPPGRTEFIPVNSEGADIPQRMVLETAKKANIERQVRMKAETAKLFKLAEELRDSVDKTNENILSLDVLKKAHEIEKLAHRVKEKMKGPN